MASIVYLSFRIRPRFYVRTGPTRMRVFAVSLAWRRRTVTSSSENFRSTTGSEETIRLGVVGFAILSGLTLACLRFRKGRRKWLQIQIVCLLPCLLLIVSDWFNWYPFTERTSLFALSCLIAVLISSLQLTSFFVLKRRCDWIRPLLDVIVLGAIVLTLKAGLSNNYRFLGPSEDMDGAVSFLHTHVEPEDFLWVHTSCWEAFKLYARMDKWRDAPARFGRTGWPCCARGINYTSDISSAALSAATSVAHFPPTSLAGCGYSTR